MRLAAATCREIRRRWWLFPLLCLLPGLWGIGWGLRPVYRGVNDAGAEFEGPTRSQGLRFSTDATLRYVARCGFQIVRVPFPWEALQPRLGGSLDARSLRDLKAYVSAARHVGLRVILDPHNYARYTWKDEDGVAHTTVIGDAPVTIERFAQFWRLVAWEFRDDPVIYAYGLMNEPYEIGIQTWKDASQAALLAIRETGDRHLVLVPGCYYSACHKWANGHGPFGWIVDPARNYAYEAHCYFDEPPSGRYQSTYQQELLADPTLEERTLRRLEVFINWCDENGVRGAVTEFGCPEDPRWERHLDRFLTRLDEAHLDATAWALGDRWPESYHMTLHPWEGYSKERSQITVLRRHLGGRTASLPSDFRMGYVKAGRRARGLARWARHRLAQWRHSLLSAVPR